jgi:1,6-anhydro-N-acetylmuramate kinase
VTTNKEAKMALVEFKTVAGQRVAINAGAVAAIEEVTPDESAVELRSGTTRHRLDSSYELVCRDLADAGATVNGPA